MTRHVVRCPKCGDAHLTLREDWIERVLFEQDADGHVSSTGRGGRGAILGVWATCAICHHEWKVPVRTMDDVEGFSG